MYKEVYKKPEQLNGKTIKSCEVIKAEYGRTNDSYLLFVFEDNTRHICSLTHFYTYEPHPYVDEMKKAPNFYSAEEIGEEVTRLENKKRQRENEIRKKKERELERLKSELGV